MKREKRSNFTKVDKEVILNTYKVVLQLNAETATTDVDDV